MLLQQVARHQHQQQKKIGLFPPGVKGYYHPSWCQEGSTSLLWGELLVEGCNGESCNGLEKECACHCSHCSLGKVVKEEEG